MYAQTNRDREPGKDSPTTFLHVRLSRPELRDELVALNRRLDFELGLLQAQLRLMQDLQDSGSIV